MKYFSIPADYSKNTIDSYCEINNTYKHSCIHETYGQIAPLSPIGSCSINHLLPEIDEKKMEKYISYSKTKNISFNYVLNSTCMENEELTTKGYRKIKSFLKKIHNIGVECVTISLPSLMEIVKSIIPNIKIKASTTCQINSPTKAKFYEEFGVDRITLDEDIVRRFDIIKNIRKLYKGNIEIIVNSFCILDCPYKVFHRNSFSHSYKNKDVYPFYSKRCRHNHMKDANFIKTSFIRPEDIHYYYDAGINYYKIQGRTNVYYGDPVKTILFYIKEKYEGDLIRLLEMFSSKRPLAFAKLMIDNSSLNGFMDKFVNTPESCTKLCLSCGYCSNFANKCISHNDRLAMDMARISTKNTISEFPQLLDI